VQVFPGIDETLLDSVRLRIKFEQRRVLRLPTRTAAVAPERLNGVYGGTKAFVLAFSQSLHHELADKGVRIQVVLPGATSTEFWDIAGLPVSSLPTSIVMSAADMVDASLAGLDQGELVTIPALPDIADWNTFEAARQALGPNLSHSKPTERLLSR
jgi:short-subunit dehydrogenase